MLRDATGNYYHVFIINAVMAALGIALICSVNQKTLNLLKR
jgi:hypothetical protein